MIFTETKLKGAFVIRPEKNEDHRGFFARTFCRNEFEAHGLNPSVVQCSVSYNKWKGTFRGMHFQLPPYEEDKVVFCVRGAFMDYIVDLRPDSPTFKKWVSVELTAESGCSLYIPRSFAHGYLTLVNDTVIHYQMSQYYQPEYARGFRHDDPAFNIRLPFAATTISARDKAFKDLLIPID